MAQFFRPNKRLMRVDRSCGVVGEQVGLQMTKTEYIRAEAINWLIRLRDGDAADWEALTLWLEGDARRAAIYRSVALDDAELPLPSRTRLPEIRANDNAPLRWNANKAMIATATGALAACAIAVITVPQFWLSQGRYAVTTRPGEQRHIVLRDGTRITLNGSSILTLDHNDVRTAQLDRGEALFSVRHDPKAPFAVIVGSNRIEDVGTVFNVLRRGKGVSVEVAQGAVVYNPAQQAIALRVGQTLSDSGETSPVEVGTRAPDEIGTWSRGRLTYHETSLAAVADDLARNIGEPVTVDPAIASRQFTGVIQVERNRKTLFARLAAVLGLDARRTVKGWKISMPERAHQ